MDRASLAPLLPILWRWEELQHFSQQRKLRWPLPQSRREAFERFAAIYSQNGMGELNVYEDTNLDQSPLAWLEQELFAPAIPACKGYQSRAGFIGLSSTGGSVLCPNKTCAETGARLCDGLGGKCAGFSFFQPAD